MRGASATRTEARAPRSPARRPRLQGRDEDVDHTLRRHGDGDERRRFRSGDLGAVRRRLERRRADPDDGPEPSRARLGRLDADRERGGPGAEARRRTPSCGAAATRTATAAPTIDGATGNTYTLTQAAAGRTLRVSVVATNGGGRSPSTHVRPAPTASVPAATAAPRAPARSRSRDLRLPARLSIDEATITPQAGDARDAHHPAAHPRHGVRRPARAGRVGLRDADPVQPVRRARTRRPGRTAPSRSRRSGGAASPPEAGISTCWRCSSARRSPATRCSAACPPAARSHSGSTCRRGRHSWRHPAPRAGCRRRSGGAGEKLVDLGRAAGGAAAARPPRHAHRLEHPGDERNAVGQQREHQPPGREGGTAALRSGRSAAPPRRRRRARAPRRSSRRAAAQVGPRACR